MQTVRLCYNSVGDIMTKKLFKTGNDVLKFLAVHFIVIGLIFSIVGAVILYSETVKKNTWIASEATIIGFDEYGDMPIMQYEFNGETYQAKSNYSTPVQKIGDTEEIYICPDYPRTISAVKSSALLTGLFLGIGLWFIIAGAAFFIFILLRKKRKDKLLSEGERLICLITDCSVNRRINAFGKCPFQLTAMYEDSTEKYYFKSESSFEIDTNCIGRQVFVYAEYGNRKAYYVDLSSVW